jgi:hypothetical protein
MAELMAMELVFETHSITVDLDHFLGGVPLEDLIAEDFAWQEGWEYRLPSFPCTQNPPG